MEIPISSAITAVMTTAVLLLAAGRLAEGQSLDCAVKLVPCEDYLNSTNPSSECCDAMKTVVTTQLPCLCGLIRNPSALAGINMTQALELPKHCGFPSHTGVCDVVEDQDYYSPLDPPVFTSPSEDGSSISGGVVAGIVIGVLETTLFGSGGVV